MNRVFALSSKIDIGGINPKAAASLVDGQLDISAVYVALRTLTPEPEIHTKQTSIRGDISSQTPALEHLNSNKRIVILGDPGSGKTTFTNFVAACICGEILGNKTTNLKLLSSSLPSRDDHQAKAKAKNSKKHATPTTWEHGALIPIRVVLRDFVVRTSKSSIKNPGAAELWKFIADDLGTASLSEFGDQLRREAMGQGALLILDGLDEISDAHKRRSWVKHVIEDFAATHPQCRIVVTSRTYAYQQQGWKLNSFTDAILAPFDYDQIVYFTKNWYSHFASARGIDKTYSQSKADSFMAAICDNERLLSLARRPLLLTLMVSLHAWAGGRLPEKREALYSETVDLLLERWEAPKKIYLDSKKKESETVQPSLTSWLDVDRDRIRRWINELAFEAHKKQPENSSTADISEGEIVSTIVRIARNPDVRPSRLVEYLHDRAGIIVQRGVEVYGFPHRTFQEYLAACYLTDHDFPRAVSELARENPSRWREVAVLAAAKAARGSSFAIWALVDNLVFREPNSADMQIADAWGALLSGQAISENIDTEHLNVPEKLKVNKIQNWLVFLMQSDMLPAVERAAAGVYLSRLKDPRREIANVDEMTFCCVPEGKFWMGSDIEKGVEKGVDDQLRKPAHIVDVPYPFWISRYPVTSAQFSQFLKENHHKINESPVFFLDEVSSRPVVRIGIEDAYAFCEWLTSRWRASGILQEGWVVSIPSEPEWEKSARGGLSIPQNPVVAAAQTGCFSKSSPLSMVENQMPLRLFPWGNEPDAERANCLATRIGTRSSVGCFAGGKSVYGCEEMSGNVWEWTRTLWRKEKKTKSKFARFQGIFSYPYNPNDGRERYDLREEHVVRGGAYHNIEISTRCTVRYDGDNQPHDNIGFRVVCRPVLNDKK